MSATNIEWADRVWNPVTGCTKVSAGCKHCYAETLAGRFWKDRRFTDVQVHPDRLDAPLRWRKPARIFVNSMSDLFHEAVPNAFIDQVFAVMALCRQHTFIVLTKRPERMRAYMTRPGSMCSRETTVNGAIWSQLGTRRGSKIEHGGNWRCAWPIPNAILGVSVEDQTTADARIPLLLQTPAALRAVSLEPLLGPVDLDRLYSESEDGREQRWDSAISGKRFSPWADGYVDCTTLDWVIVGGESGPKARPCDVAWIRSVVRQCQAAGVACFVKQLGAKPVGFPYNTSTWVAQPTEALPLSFITNRKGADMSEWPADLRVREFPAVAR